jgi:hypothetical protein
MRTPRNTRNTRRRRRSRGTILFAGGIAILAALALIAITTSSGGMFGQPDATAAQRTRDMIVQTRLALTAERRATQTAESTAEATPEATETFTPEVTPVQ